MSTQPWSTFSNGLVKTARIVMTEKILIPWSEFRGDTGWKIRKDGLIEDPNGRTEFPDRDAHGNVIGSHSYYLDQLSAPVTIRHNMLKRMDID